MVFVKVLQCRACPATKANKRWYLRVRFRSADPKNIRIAKTYRTPAYFATESEAKDKAPYLRWFVKQNQAVEIFEQEWRGDRQPSSSKFYRAYQAWLGKKDKSAEKKRKGSVKNGLGSKKRQVFPHPWL
jgi:hypothetical protein